MPALVFSAPDFKSCSNPSRRQIQLMAVRCFIPQSLSLSLFRGLNTLQPLYNMVRNNTVLDITPFRDGSQKYINYIEK